MALFARPTDHLHRAFQDLFGVELSDPTILHEMFHAAGAPGFPDGNKILALLGDTALQLSLQYEGRARQASRKKVSQVVADIAGNKNLAQRGHDLGLHRFIRNNPSQGTYISDSLMATTVEAIIGGVLIDKNWDRDELQKVITALGLSWPE